MKLPRMLRCIFTLVKLLPAVCCKARHLFGSDNELSLELYKDPEFEDRYLTLYMRQEEYLPDTMDRIEAVRRQFDEALENVSGQLLITTDFRRPRGPNGRLRAFDAGTATQWEIEANSGVANAERGVARSAVSRLILGLLLPGIMPSVFFTFSTPGEHPDDHCRLRHT